MSSVHFSDSEIDDLRGLHVGKTWIAELSLPSETLYLHAGVGSFDIGGIAYEGVSDPVGGRLASVQNITNPGPGRAAAVSIVVSGADPDFFSAFADIRHDIEGRGAVLSFVMFDGETNEVIGEPRQFFPKGYMSAPRLVWGGIGQRSVILTVESIFSAKNFKAGGRWNGAGHRELYPTDNGMDYTGQSLPDHWQW
jgi:hypothetical protein